jgi:hypothetical protein
MKVIIVGIGLFLSNISVSAQISYHAYRSGVESYDKKSESWNNDKSLPVDLTIKIEKKRLTIGDAKNSTYVLRTWNAGFAGWEALDVKGKKWYIVFMEYPDDSVKMMRISFYHKIGDTSSTYYDVTRK